MEKVIEKCTKYVDNNTKMMIRVTRVTDFLKTFAPHSLMTTYQMDLILARSISLDSSSKAPYYTTHYCVVNAGG